MVEIDGNFSTVAHLIPRCGEELTVRQSEAFSAPANAVRGNNDDRCGVGEERDEWHDTLDERGKERFHTGHGNALRDGFSECAQRRRALGEKSGSLSDRRGQRNLPHRGEFHGRNLTERTLVGNRKLAQIVDVVAEEVAANGVPGEGREHVEDSPSNRHFPSARHHIDPLITQFNQGSTDVEGITAVALGEHERLSAGEV